MAPSGERRLAGHGEGAFKTAGFKLSALKIDFAPILGVERGEPFRGSEDPVELQSGEKCGDSR